MNSKQIINSFEAAFRHVMQQRYSVRLPSNADLLQAYEGNPDFDILVEVSRLMQPTWLFASPKYVASLYEQQFKPAVDSSSSIRSSDSSTTTACFSARSKFDIVFRNRFVTEAMRFIAEKAGVPINSPQEMIAHITQANRGNRLDWRELDARVGIDSAAYKKGNFSYRYLHDTILPQFTVPWPAEWLYKVDSLVDSLCESAGQVGSGQQYEIAAQVYDTLELRKQPYSFKKIQDRIRYRIKNALANGNIRFQEQSVQKQKQTEPKAPAAFSEPGTLSAIYDYDYSYCQDIEPIQF